MNTFYVGLDLGSSSFQQVALNHTGVSRVKSGPLEIKSASSGTLSRKLGQNVRDGRRDHRHRRLAIAREFPCHSIVGHAALTRLSQ